jgi:hypothetical protein
MKTVEKPLCYIDLPKFGFRMKVWKVLKPSGKSGATFRRPCLNSSATALRSSAFTALSAVTGKGSSNLKQK